MPGQALPRPPLDGGDCLAARQGAGCADCADESLSAAASDLCTNPPGSGLVKIASLERRERKTMSGPIGAPSQHALFPPLARLCLATSRCRNRRLCEHLARAPSRGKLRRPLLAELQEQHRIEHSSNLHGLLVQTLTCPLQNPRSAPVPHPCHQFHEMVAASPSNRSHAAVDACPSNRSDEAVNASLPHFPFDGNHRILSRMQGQSLCGRRNS
mmetsp:Transcript_92080/g.159808  ORF Transcript_92080/g.159808 Transcript_92080/m.159808 type:complete len:213 (+) Transcript_92080:246-884(+)